MHIVSTYLSLSSLFLPLSLPPSILQGCGTPQIPNGEEVCEGWTILQWNGHKGSFTHQPGKIRYTFSCCSTNDKFSSSLPSSIMEFCVVFLLFTALPSLLTLPPPSLACSSSGWVGFWADLLWQPSIYPSLLLRQLGHHNRSASLTVPALILFQVYTHKKKAYVHAASLIPGPSLFAIPKAGLGLGAGLTHFLFYDCAHVIFVYCTLYVCRSQSDNHTLEHSSPPTHHVYIVNHTSV